MMGMQVLWLQPKNITYFDELKQFIDQNYKGNKVRENFFENFRNWAYLPLQEQWRLSRLGKTLPERKLTPKNPMKVSNSIFKKFLKIHILLFLLMVLIEMISQTIFQII